MHDHLFFADILKPRISPEPVELGSHQFADLLVSGSGPTKLVEKADCGS